MADQTHDLGTFAQGGGPFRLMTETRGPAFEGMGSQIGVSLIPGLEGTRPMIPNTFTNEWPVKIQLESSVASRTAVTIGQLLNALGLPRQCFLDVMPAWTRLLKILDITIPNGEHGPYRCEPRQSWEFAEMRELVVLALCHQEEGDRVYHWALADATLRGYALHRAAQIEARLDRQDVSAESLRLAGDADSYRAFGEGK